MDEERWVGEGSKEAYVFAECSLKLNFPLEYIPENEKKNTKLISFCFCLSSKLRKSQFTSRTQAALRMNSSRVDENEQKRQLNQQPNLSQFIVISYSTIINHSQRENDFN